MTVQECRGCGEDCLNKLCMHKIPVLSSLDREEMGQISLITRHRKYGKGEVILAQGESQQSLVIVSEGSAKAFKITPDGREQILYVFSQGDFFGERNLFGGQKAPYTVQTLEAVKTCIFTRDDFQQLLMKRPDISIKIIEELEGRIARMESALQSMGVRSLDGRISALLLEFSEKYGTAVPEGTLIRLPLSREGLANFLGIARETVSRKLSQMEDEGLIRSVSNKSILVLDFDALRASAGKTD